jgi:DNA-binding beta-propeller fold protein YncE
MHGMAYNPLRDEITVPQVFAQSILTFRGGATGEEPPIRVIQGPMTQLRGSSKLEIDPVHNELFVPDGRRIQVFDLLANGNVPPIRVLSGPDTMLGADSATVDPIHNRLIVVGSLGSEAIPENNAILIFDRTAQGNTKPLAVIKGPKTRLQGTFGVRVYPKTGFFAVSMDGPDTSAPPTIPTMVGIWSINDNGDVAPRYTVGGPYGMLKLPRGLDFDPKNKTILISDKLVNAVLTYSLPEIF